MREIPEMPTISRRLIFFLVTLCIHTRFTQGLPGLWQRLSRDGVHFFLFSLLVYAKNISLSPSISYQTHIMTSRCLILPRHARLKEKKGCDI